MAHWQDVAMRRFHYQLNRSSGAAGLFVQALASFHRKCPHLRLFAWIQARFGLHRATTCGDVDALGRLRRLACRRQRQCPSHLFLLSRRLQRPCSQMHPFLLTRFCASVSMLGTRSARSDRDQEPSRFPTAAGLPAVAGAAGALESAQTRCHWKTANASPSLVQTVEGERRSPMSSHRPDQLLRGCRWSFPHSRPTRLPPHQAGSAPGTGHHSRPHSSHLGRPHRCLPLAGCHCSCTPCHADP